MDTFQAILLGVVEGITEFLPISSTAHLLLAGKVVGVEQSEFVKSFDIIIQFGAILAVLFYTRSELFNLEKLKNIGIAFVPTGLVGFLLYGLIKNIFLESHLLALAMLILGGVLIVWREKFVSNRHVRNVGPVGHVVIGLFQSLSVIPGVSRALVTIYGAELVGMERREAVKFSFLLAVPTMAAATVFDLSKVSWGWTQNEWVNLGVGFFVSMITAYFAVRWLMSLANSRGFAFFGWYRILVGVVGLILLS